MDLAEVTNPPAMLSFQNGTTPGSGKWNATPSPFPQLIVTESLNLPLPPPLTLARRVLYHQHRAIENKALTRRVQAGQEPGRLAAMKAVMNSDEPYELP